MKFISFLIFAIANFVAFIIADIQENQNMCMDSSSSEKIYILRDKQERIYRDILEKVLTELSDKEIILLHDGRNQSLNFVEKIQTLSIFNSFILLDVSKESLLEADWMKQLNSEEYLHITVVFGKDVFVNYMTLLPDRLWIPQHLLILNLMHGESLDTELNHWALRHTPYITLIQTTIKLDYPFTDFHGHRFHLASWIDDFPYLHFGKDLQNPSGMGAEMLRSIAAKLNFTFQVYEYPIDDQWAIKENGSWKGMLGELVREERDICINVMSFDWERIVATDFSVWYFWDADSYAARNPLPVPKYLAVIYPFTGVSWISIGILIIVVFLFVLIFEKIKEDASIDVPKTFLQILTPIIKQVYDFQWKTSSYRLLAISWWLSALVLSTMYTCNLIAYLTIPAKPQRIQALEELNNVEGREHLRLDYGNFFKEFIKTTTNPLYKALGKKLNFVILSYQELLDKVENENSVLLEGMEYLQYQVIITGSENSYIIKEPFLTGPVGWAYQKNTPYVQKINFFITALVEAGLIVHWHEEMLRNLKKENKFNEVDIYEQKIRALTLQDIQGPFMIYGIGCGLALLVWLFEIIKKSFKNK